MDKMIKMDIKHKLSGKCLLMSGPNGSIEINDIEINNFINKIIALKAPLLCTEEELKLYNAIKIHGTGFLSVIDLDLATSLEKLGLISITHDRYGNRMATAL